jgi:putative peptide zinc metalloprotease protein
LLLVLGAIHEFGHGLTCKHFGGDVHQMGFLLIYFTPAFYTDTTDILLFTKGSRRQWVLFAGIWIEMVLCGLAALVWHFTPAGSVTNDVAYKMMLLSGIQGAVLNLNPLIKADGYYALSQFLDIDNLREDSFEFLRAWTRKYLLFQDVDLPPTTLRQRRIFFIFGVCAVIYSTSLLILVLLFVKNVLVSKLGDWGYLATLGVIYFFARKGIRQAIPVVRGWLRQKKEDFMAWKVTRLQQVGAAGLAVLLLIPPMATRVSTGLILEPGKSASIRAQIAGQVRDIQVRNGEAVKAGQVLATLRNPEMETEFKMLADEMSVANSHVRNGQDRSDFDETAVGARERTRLSQELVIAERNVESLKIRAPIDGIVVTDDLDQKAGSYIQPGDDLGKIVDRSSMRARILVRDWELEDVSDGATVKVKVAPFPFRTYSGSVEKILPAAALDHPVAQTQDLERLGQKLTNYFAVEMEFPNADGSLREGMTGTARIAGKSSPLAWQFCRGTWRWAKSQIW